MRLARFTILAVVAVVASCGDGSSFDRNAYQTARQSRSALQLAEYIASDLHDGYKDQARALLDKHFEYALANHDGDLARALLTSLRAAGDPRIGVRMAAPALDAGLSGGARKYFGEGSEVYRFANGASRAATSVFAHEVLVFDDGVSIGLDEVEPSVWVDVEWRVYPSAAVFSGPHTIANMYEQPAPVQGIAIEATLTFTTADGVYEQPAVSGAAGEGFTYSATMGFADEYDMYAGMAEAAFEAVVGQVF